MMVIILSLYVFGLDLGFHEKKYTKQFWNLFDFYEKQLITFHMYLYLYTL